MRTQNTDKSVEASVGCADFRNALLKANDKKESEYNVYEFSTLY